ncbi:hypothetical protein MP228_005349 [Amoeboaphelidium protococcarum]|nr:hypothetical protein MP228_005349 [Amoeboaphelidium protococcarum]
MSRLSKLFDFEEQLAFYAKYHNTKWNQIVHFVFVPLIFWTALVWASNWTVIDHTPVTGSYVVTLIYACYYILLEPMAGALYSPLLFGLAYGANHFLLTYGKKNANMYALYLHVFSWVAQFLSHGLVEKRAPALNENFTQALLLAPFFVWFELLFALGYRPQLKSRLEQRIKAELQSMDGSKVKLNNGKKSE